MTMPLPSLVIAGERRCGTTSLANGLSTHPEIFMHSKRDSGYFVDEHVRKGGPQIDWETTHSISNYEGFFSDATGANKVVVGEKSADYLFFTPAHERLARFLPEAKFLLILRNPVARAWSHYWNEVGKGRETFSFPDALKAEKRRQAKGGFEAYHLSYVARGKYDESLSNFFKFIPPKQCHVVILESLMAQTLSSLKEITAFLGIAEFEHEPLRAPSNSNWTMVPRPWAAQQPVRAVANLYAGIAKGAVSLVGADREHKRRIMRTLSMPFFREASSIAMDKTTRAELTEIFDPHIGRLEDMLGISLSLWRVDDAKFAPGKR